MVGNLALIAIAGTLFYFMIRALARIQMPSAPRAIRDAGLATKSRCWRMGLPGQRHSPVQGPNATAVATGRGAVGEAFGGVIESRRWLIPTT